MKKYIILALSLLTVLGCAQFEELKGVSEVKPLTTGITVTTNTVDASVPRPDSYTVRFINYDEKLDISAQTDAAGKVSVSNLIPGRYNVTVSAEVAHSGFTYYYSGTLTNKIITSDTSLSIDVAASKAGALVFKEIYFNGSTGYYFKDQFYEIYNNSDDVQYVDGLCIGTLMPATASTTIYNWIVEDGHPENYVYLGAVWQIPGGGTDYPVKPGESIIIAQGAQNHMLIKETSPVDLSKAEFETFMVNQTVNPDNPESVNMTLKIDFNVFGTQWLSSVFGCAYVIFFLLIPHRLHHRCRGVGEQRHQDQPETYADNPRCRRHLHRRYLHRPEREPQDPQHQGRPQPLYGYQQLLRRLPGQRSGRGPARRCRRTVLESGCQIMTDP